MSTHAEATAEQALLEVRHLKKYYPVRGGFLRRVVNWVKALDDVSFSIPKGQTLGIVGESGCGKSTLGRAVLRLIDAQAEGVWLNGVNLQELTGGELRRARRQMQIIFQDPESSLNPRMRVEDIIAAPLDVHGLVHDRRQRRKEVDRLLEAVGLDSSHADRYPHDFSGGQKQRIGIARALAAQPSLIVADEPVSALDVSVQAQVVNLMRDLQREFNLTYLFISHDLSIVRHVSEQVAVMYLGKIVEQGETRELFDRPLHPYTRRLIEAIPVANPGERRKELKVGGEVPSPIDPPPGCRFHTRCPFAQENCSQVEPPLEETEADRLVACHWWKEIRDGVLQPREESNET
jgi:oligopeptide/dipeptide ABC transporter ATP-binding protein